MKLSFSTNGWELSFSELIKVLAENRIQGLEIHDINAPGFEKEKPFDRANTARTKKALFESGVAVSCIDAVANLADKSAAAAAEAEIKRAVEVAADLGCEYVRLHAYTAEKTEEKYRECDEFLFTFLPPLITFAEERGVTLLMETMGVYADTGRLAEFLGAFACDNFSA